MPDEPALAAAEPAPPAAVEPGAGPGQTFAVRLDRLFRSVRPRNGNEFTYREVADGVQCQGGPTISASYVWQLRAGVKDNPTKRHIEALAAFFGVAPAYFFDDQEAQAVEAELALLVAMRDAGIRDLALRATGLSPESIDLIRDVIERTRSLEGLDGRRGASRAAVRPAGTANPPGEPPPEGS